ncbi:hypothetical protein Y1Q_0020912 [Alligator mississippiensis]|uniref:Uncharacterized protein n=1 Tax=Alligator mississippiensis TaxID=8496 RepID=A0A151NJB2_ALLMI|nr:hypothetical protein Y1Q_0020912 [Alligator mississippiensis]
MRRNGGLTAGTSGFTTSTYDAVCHQHFQGYPNHWQEEATKPFLPCWDTVKGTPISHFFCAQSKKVGEEHAGSFAFQHSRRTRKLHMSVILTGPKTDETGVVGTHHTLKSGHSWGNVFPWL